MAETESDKQYLKNAPKEKPKTSPKPAFHSKDHVRLLTDIQLNASDGINKGGGSVTPERETYDDPGDDVDEHVCSGFDPVKTCSGLQSEMQSRADADGQCCRRSDGIISQSHSEMDVSKSDIDHEKEKSSDSKNSQERKKPEPKPRISLLKKQHTEGMESPGGAVNTCTYSSHVSTESSGSRSLNRTNSYQAAVDSLLDELAAAGESLESVSSNVVSPESEPVNTNLSYCALPRSDESMENIVNSNIAKELVARPQRRQPPPLPAKRPVGQPNLCTDQLNVTAKRSPLPPKTMPKPPKQRLEVMNIHATEIGVTKIPASISTPNICQHDEVFLDNPANSPRRVEHHQSALDIKEKKKPEKLFRAWSRSDSKDESRKNKKSQERRRSSQFYFSLDGEEESTLEKTDSHWWSFGKGGKKRGVKKSTETSSVFYCGVNEGGTLKFDDTKQVDLHSSKDVAGSEDDNQRSRDVMKPTTPAHNTGQATVKILDEYVKKCVKESEDIPKPPPRMKRKSHLLVMRLKDSSTSETSQEDADNKHVDFCPTMTGHYVHSNSNDVSGAAPEPHPIGQGGEVVDEEQNPESSSSQAVDMKAGHDDKDGKVQSVPPTVVIQSESKNMSCETDDGVVDDRKQISSNVTLPIDETSNVYMPMSVSMPSDLSAKVDSVHCRRRSVSSGSSESSDDYIPMTPQTEVQSGLLSSDVKHTVRPSSWAGPDSDDAQYDDKDDKIELFDFSQNSSSDEMNEVDDEADSHLRDTLQSLATMKEKLTRRRMKAFYAAQEIVTSEESFVEVLKLLNEDFRQHVLSAKGPLGGPVVPMKEVEQILKYLPLLQNFSEELLKDLKSRIDNWDNCQKIADVFIEKGPFLKMYSDYIREFESLCICLDEARKRFPEFDKAVTQFENSSKCSNMAIKHFMLKPVQRIPQYRLLLNEYRKYLDEDSEDFEDSKVALDIVSGVAEHANQSMALETNIKKLIEIQNSLIGDFEVVKPGRLLVKSGILKKLCRKEMQSRMFFLFTDTLLCTSPLSSGYRFKTSLLLDGMKVNKPSKEDFANEFSIISTTRSFRLSASTSEERDEWLKTLQKTISEYRQKKYSYLLKTNKCQRRTMPLDTMIQNDIDFKLGKQAPVWVPDSRVSMCAKCHEEFTVTFRRHHCRACGKVFCGLCSDNRAPLCYQNYKPGRVCIDCFNYLKAEATAMINNLQHADPKQQITNSIKIFIRSFSRGNSQGRDTLWSSFGKGKRKRSSLLQEVKAFTEDADTSGYMEIWENKRWKKMWFVLKNKVLYFYRASEDTAAVKSIVLVGFEVQTFKEQFQKVDPSLIFQVIHKNVSPVILKCENEASRNRWLKYMKQAVIP